MFMSVVTYSMNDDEFVQYCIDDKTCKRLSLSCIASIFFGFEKPFIFLCLAVCFDCS